MRELDDNSPMPFGKHKGRPMREVPVGYLHFLWENGLSKETKPVANYIRRNRKALEKEDPDLIW